MEEHIACSHPSILLLSSKEIIPYYTHTHTHAHVHVRAHIQMFVCVCVRARAC